MTRLESACAEGGMSAREILDEAGIKLSSYREGEHRGLCPRCSHTRKKKADTVDKTCGFGASKNDGLDLSRIHGAHRLLNLCGGFMVKDIDGRPWGIQRHCDNALMFGNLKRH